MSNITKKDNCWFRNSQNECIIFNTIDNLINENWTLCENVSEEYCCYKIGEVEKDEKNKSR